MKKLDSALVAVRFDIEMLHKIDDFIKNGIFSNLKEALENCVSEYFQKHPNLSKSGAADWFDSLKAVKSKNH